MKRFIYVIAWLLLLPLSVFSQNRTITGTVTNSKGDPVPFATVKLKGTSSLVTAAEDGRFSIEVTGTDITLVITSVDFITQEVKAGSSSSLNVQLQESGTLGEVVVTALGIRREKKALGYSARLQCQE